jgi:hypothetical protein
MSVHELRTVVREMGQTWKAVVRAGDSAPPPEGRARETAYAIRFARRLLRRSR